MIKRPAFNPAQHIEVMEPEGVFALSETGDSFLTGRLYRLLAPLIDGKRTTEDLVRLLSGQADAARIYYALNLMEQKGHIVEADDTVARDAAAYWLTLGVDPRTALERLQTRTVSVATFGAVDPAPFVAALEGAGIRVGEGGDLTVALTDDYMQPGLEALNKQALTSGRPWLLVKPIGRVLWLGPLFQPGESGCWECLAHRLRTNRPVERLLQRKKGTNRPFSPSVATTAASLQTALQLTVLHTARWLVLGESGPLASAILTFDPLTLEKVRHVLVRRPQCPACGDPDYFTSHPPQPIVLQSQKKRVSNDAGLRTASPEETLARYEHHVSPITGVVSALYRFENEGNGLLHTYFSGYNYAFMQDDLFFLRRHVRGANGGKGTTDIQAKVSALAEGIERYCGIFQGYEPRRRGTFREMGEAAIHPSVLLQYSEAQYRNRDEWNARSAGKHWIPVPFDDDRAIEWTAVWSLTQQRFRYVPTAMCYFGYPEPLKTAFCYADSNGNAAGNTREEAILQGLMEVVERDSVALWWYNRVRRPAVDLASFHEPYIDRLVEYYASVNRDLWVLDITTDLGIPSFAAISRRNDKPVEDIAVGFAAHLDPRIALLRALTEVNQILPALLSVKADGTGEYSYPEEHTVQWFKTATLANQPYLAPDPNVPARKLSDFPSLTTDDIRDDVLWCQRRLEGMGFEILVHDLTRPDVGFPVVKVIVPGLRHFWCRFAPGRLYDAPVQMGWLKAPLKESELNPIPVFL